MLIRFSVTNFLSIRDRQELSLAASSLKDDEAGLLNCDCAPQKKLLPSAVIYGANASGKSNFVRALNFMQSAILLSHTQGDAGGGVPRHPFALSKTSVDRPSIFDVDFAVNGIRYHYGFSATNDAFEEEWLYAYPSGRQQVLFERTEKQYKFGRQLKGRNKVISDLTRSNSLFFSAALQNDHEQLTEIGEFFRSINGDMSVSVDGYSISARLNRDEIDNRTINFLSKIGTGIVGYIKEMDEVSEKSQDFAKELSALVNKFIPEESNIDLVQDGTSAQLKLGHIGVDGSQVYFELDRESAGTRRLLILLDIIFSGLDKGSLIIIDELDASLHTFACEMLLALFNLPEANPKGAQLITTTHDTNFLQSNLLRRDQVWFSQKSRSGVTELYPLTDISTRQGDNIEKGYLEGRYGAVPFVEPILDIVQST